VQASTTKQATMTQVATSVFGQNGVVSSLPAAGTLLTTDVTNVVAGGVASQASMTQIATSVYANNTGLTTLPNASSVTVTDTTVVAQSGTNREATISQVATAVLADNTAITALPNASSVTVTDTLVVAQSGTNREATVTQLAANIFSNNQLATVSSANDTGALVTDVLGTQRAMTTVLTNWNVNTKTLARNYTNSTNNIIFPARMLFGTTQLIAAAVAMPINSTNVYPIDFNPNTGNPDVYTDLFAVIQASRFTTAGGASSALPASGTSAQIRITKYNNYPNDDVYLSFDLLNFNTTVYPNGTNAPVYKVPFKYTKGSSSAVTATSTATATGSITGNIMTVTVGPTGTAQRIVPGATSVVTGTKVVEQLTTTLGLNGGAGTYLVNNSQTVASTTLTCTGIDSSIVGFMNDMSFDSSSGSSGLLIEVTSTTYTTGSIDVLLYGSVQLKRA
jgi:hypothetical protein